MLSPYQRHKAKWNECKRCELCRIRRNVVLGRGSLPCDILFVGEAPGRSENMNGTAFCGPAGALLDCMLRRTLPGGIRCAITNLIGCIPLIPDERGNTKPDEPPDYAVQACKPRLDKFIKLAKPTMIVALGKHAQKYLGRYDLALMHPAALLRMDITQKGLAIQRWEAELSDAFEVMFR